MIRIANGQGFWGDWLEAPVRLVEQGGIDYLVLDYLAEVTMSILQKQRQADPRLGYARDFPPLVARIAKQIREKKIRVIANAGGINPVACALEVRRLAPDLKVAVVLGDDLMGRLDDLLARGHEMRNMDTGAPLSSIRQRIQSASVYLGAFPLAEALATGADVVITGRAADPALAIAPMIHHFGWTPEQYDLLAAGTVAGHILECGAQATGGNCQVDWQSMPDLANIGFPVVEMESNGTFVVTKPEGTGGRVSQDTIKEQLLYELGDPRAYLMPDCTADFTSIHLADAGPDRVRVTGVKGGPRPAQYKVSISYAYGWKTIGTLTYSWPQALEKAQVADRIVREHVAQLGLSYEAMHTEYLGVNACLGPVAPPVPDPAEVQLRIGMRGQDKKAIDRFTRELIPLVLTGPPGATGYGEGRPAVREIVAYWPALLDRAEVTGHAEVVA